MSIDALIPAEHDLDAAADPGAFIIASCERAKSWLAQALEGNHIEQLVELKCQSEAIRVYTMQKELGKDAELAAAEIVRRAERCIGLAIRKGQAAGTITIKGQGGGPRRSYERNGKTVHVDPRDETSRISPTSLGVAKGELSANGSGIYAMTDDVTDESFDAAIESAKEQRNLSRANVVRNLKGESEPGRWEGFEELAKSGLTSHQIAYRIGVTRQTVAKKAKELGIVIQADAALGRSRKKVDHGRVLAAIVDTLEATYPSCAGVDLSQVDRSELDAALKVFDRAMRALTRLRRRLRKETDG